MGGYGSTRWGNTSTRPLTSWALRLDVATLRRVPWGDEVRDVLREGLPDGGHLEWKSGRDALRLRVETGNDGRARAITSRYRSRAPGGAWRARTMYVPVVWRPANLRGEQPLFACPTCQRDRRTIYVNGLAGCRECLGLAYGSTRDSVTERAHSAASRLYHKLDPDGRMGRGALGLGKPCPPKPKGMHWRTYDRLAASYRAAVSRALACYSRELAVLAERSRCLDPALGARFRSETGPVDIFG